MGEIIPGNFNKPAEENPKSPFQQPAKIIDRYFKGISAFSENGVVEYLKGVKPRDEVGATFKVKIHAAAMERTILSIFPELKTADITEEMKELFSEMSNLDIVQQLDESQPGDWVFGETNKEKLETALWYLGLLNEAKIRDLDEPED